MEGKVVRVIVAGSRSIVDPSFTYLAIESSPFHGRITEVVSGGARGPDSFGSEWAKSRQIPVKEFPAEWGRYGRGAGMVRNREMAEYADALVVAWDGKSRGTGAMLKFMRELGKPAYIFKFPERFGTIL